MKNNKDNSYCPSIHKTSPKEKMIVGIIVLAAVAFIISLTILFTYQIEKRQRSRNCCEGNIQAEDLSNVHVYCDTFFKLSISRTISAKSVIDIHVKYFHYNPLFDKRKLGFAQKSQARKENQQLASNLLNVAVVSAFYNSRFFL